MGTKIALISLGCDKNRVDSEVMLGLLQEAGLEIITEEEKAELILINTCCFIKDALEESIETILTVAKYKEIGCLKGIIVAGCLGQRYREEIFLEMPEVDAVIGTTAIEDIVRCAKDILAGKKQQQYFEALSHMPQEPIEKNRILSTEGYYAYLKISEGCDNHCTYCIIPKLRGPHRSRTLESLVTEARKLAEAGVTEIILVGQDTSIYGRDLYGEPKLSCLLEELCKIPELKWIRLLYCYPETLTEETIAVMAREEKICRYIDIPIQHGADSVLKRMGRHTNRKKIEETIKALRSAMPDIIIRTTLITGFPGETEEEHQALLAFVSEMAFDRLGVFTFSPEEGTAAADMPDQVMEEVKEKRKDELMQLQRRISKGKCKKQIGKTLPVLVSGRLPEDGIYLGRTYGDAPEIDGLVFFTAAGELLSGEYVSVKITKANDYDLIGDVVYGNEFGE